MITTTTQKKIISEIRKEIELTSILIKLSVGGEKSRLHCTRRNLKKELFIASDYLLKQTLNNSVEISNK